MASSNLKKISGEPRYVTLALRLAKEIQKRKYPVGSLLPTEAELTSKYSISRFTVREAIRQLQSQGLVIRRQGVGTRVLTEKPVHHFLQARNTVEEVLQYGVQSLLNEMATTNVTADANLAERIGCAEEDKFLKITGLRMPVNDPDGLPVCWTEIFVLSEYAGIRDEIGRGNVLIANLIEDRYGQRAIEIQQDITAVSLPGEIAKKLGVQSNSPGLLVRRWYIGADSKAFEVTVSLHPGARFSYSMRMMRDTDA
jgi:DNA-binding GntR family transcriptional regulator